MLKLCEYKGYSAIYTVIDYGFENSDVWKQTSEVWLNIKNSQTPEALPEAAIGVTVTGKGLPDSILTVCSFYPDIFDFNTKKEDPSLKKSFLSSNKSVAIQVLLPHEIVKLRSVTALF